jgi:hypothetical protein
MAVKICDRERVLEGKMAVIWQINKINSLKLTFWIRLSTIFVEFSWRVRNFLVQFFAERAKKA